MVINYDDDQSLTEKVEEYEKKTHNVGVKFYKTCP